MRHENQYLHTLHLRDRFLTVTSPATNALGHKLSRPAVTWRLMAHGIEACRPNRRHSLTAQNRRLILRWILAVRPRQLRYWQRVDFTDEGRCCKVTVDGSQRVYRRGGFTHAISLIYHCFFSFSPFPSPFPSHLEHISWH